MSLRTRRVLYISAIVLFFVTAPLLVLYTAGFRFDFAKRSLRPTGSLFIKTLPEDVQVYINDELIDDETPLRLNHLTPSTYAIRITKEGYDSWYKSLDVRTQETTFAENIILWKQHPEEETIARGIIDSFWIDPENRYILYQTPTTLEMLHISSQEKTTVIATLATSTDLAVTWSDDSAHALVYASSTHWVVSTKDQRATKLIDDTGTISQARFHPTDTNRITYSTPRGIFEYAINTQTKSSLFSVPVLSYFISGDDIYYITGPDPTLLTRAPRTVDDMPPVFELPNSATLQLEDIVRDFIFVYDKDQQLLYTLSLQPDAFNQQSHIFSDVLSWEFDDAKEKLLLQNDIEVIVVNLPEFSEQTITRVSTPIQRVAWYYDDNYILIVYPNKLELTELDRRDYRNTSTVWEQTVVQAVLAQDGEHIFVLTNNDTEQQLLRIAVTDLGRSFFSF